MFANPRAVITAPTEEEPGNLVRLDPAGSVGKLHWLILPKWAKRHIGEALDHSLLFACNKPGTYTFVLIATKRSKVATAVHELQLGVKPPEPDPEPPDPPEPEPDGPLAALKRAAYEIAMKHIPTENRRQAATVLIVVYETAVRRIEAGEYGDLVQARIAVREAGQKALTSEHGWKVNQAWTISWAMPLGEYVEQAVEPKASLPKFATALKAVVAGLKKVT